MRYRLLRISYFSAAPFHEIIFNSFFQPLALSEEMKKLDKKPNYMTVPAAIKELEKIEMVRQLDNIYRLDHVVTANQKVILKAFGLDANSIKYFASELSKELKKAE